VPARAVGRAILSFFGWRIEGAMPDLPKFVISVAPHTSNWDFVIGGATMFALDLRMSFLGKHTLFRGPLAPLMRWMGGIPVDRSSPHGVVGDAVRAFAESGQRVLAIAPQGTRSAVARFKSGFVQIAHDARVPIVIATLDYRDRVVRLGPVLTPSDDVQAEVARIEALYEGIRGKHPR
jgi:1-acyl-sn-glycerol-3-phosphate acyltransferase